MAQSSQGSQHWSSYSGFMLACIGAAVGLGNIWKFPYMVGANGGSAFVLIYLLTIASIAIPVAAAEIALGRLGQAGPVESLHNIAKSERRTHWVSIGADIGVLASYLLLTFYAVIAGWVLSYVYRAITGSFNALSSEASQNMFQALQASPTEMIVMQGLFLLTVTFILSRDITSGLERANRIMMPMLFIMLLAVSGYGLIAGNPKEALAYLLTPDFSKLNNATIAAAVGQGFFSVGVGSAILITFGAYMNKNIKIGSAALTIGIADTAIALLAGFGIFAIVFSQGLDPASGPGLIFITLPVAFSSIPGGYMLGILFFILVLFAALTSALALAEVTISWAEYRLNISRRFASWAVLLSNFMIGLLTVFSFNLLSEFRLAETGFWADKNLFEVKDYIASSILMPVSGLLIVFFAYWGIKSYRLEQAFGQERKIFKIWLWLGRIISPLGIIWVFWTNL